MASQQDLQELLRLLTSRKMTMMEAMGQIKSLQAVNLRSIQQIAEGPLSTVEAAFAKDPKAAKPLQNACKAHIKRFGVGGTKRPANGDGTASSKRAKYSDAFMAGPLETQTPQQIEAALELPVDMVEEKIHHTVLQTNRAPLVLAFAVELLRYTMPEQPPSSRLSLGQAVVSANSRTKAVSIGIDKGPSADEEGWGEGQPRIRIMGREVAVLKRGGYEWKGDEVEGKDGENGVKIKDDGVKQEDEATTQSTATIKQGPSATSSQQSATLVWTASSTLSSRSSTFIAHATSLPSPAPSPAKLLDSLFTTHQNLRTATHNAYAVRSTTLQFGSSSFMNESSSDDGETGAGDLLLKIMRELNATNTFVVMTRWYGGIMLGPDRWRLMRNVVTGALSERLRVTGAEVSIGGEAVWGLDLEGMKKSAAGGGGSKAGGGGGHAGLGDMQIHRPEGAKNYLLKSFATAPGTSRAEFKSDDGDEDADEAEAEKKGKTKTTTPKKMTIKQQDAEKAGNLALLMGALRLLFDSWADHITPGELDSKAWSWYAAVRPDVESGPSGWGAKGTLKLSSILDLRRTAG